jgi:uncharacterized protein YndB with AHSA1/START domain
MKPTHIKIRAYANAPLETTWSVLADQRGMTRWLPASVSLEREGDPPPNGVGTIRVMTRRPFRVREQITHVEKPSRLAYRLLSGVPVRHYVGETTLTGDDSKTEITWTIDLTPRFLGIAFIVRKVIQAAATNLAAASERDAREDETSR